MTVHSVQGRTLDGSVAVRDSSSTRFTAATLYVVQPRS
jgi:hypothetical protein